MSKKYFGLRWVGNSCWMDASLMSLFFPTKLSQFFMPFIKNNTNHKLSVVKRKALSVIENLRQPNVGNTVTVFDLRDELHKLTRHKKDKEMELAFLPHGVEGYVFYFIVEFLELFSVKPLIGHKNGKKKEFYVLEIEDCSGSNILSCLNKNFKGWRWDKNSLNYLIIELVNSHVEPQEFITWNKIRWELVGMIVFDCSHFVSYLKIQNQWFLYDDGNTFHGIPMQEYDFGQYYRKNMCHFQYGEKNTFFFFARA